MTEGDRVIDRPMMMPLNPNGIYKARRLKQDNEASESESEGKKQLKLSYFIAKVQKDQYPPKVSFTKFRENSQFSEEEEEGKRSRIPFEVQSTLERWMLKSELMSEILIKGNKTAHDSIVYYVLDPIMFSEFRTNRCLNNTIIMHGKSPKEKALFAKHISSKLKWVLIGIDLKRLIQHSYGDAEEIMYYSYRYALENRPCVLYYDNFEALLSNSLQLKEEKLESILSTFETNLNEIVSSKDLELIYIVSVERLSSIDSKIVEKFNLQLHIDSEQDLRIKCILVREFKDSKIEINDEDYDDLIQNLRQFELDDIVNIWDEAKAIFEEELMERKTMCPDGNVATITIRHLNEAINFIKERNESSNE